MWALDIGCTCIDVGFWLKGCWIWVDWTLDIGCMDVGFKLGGCLGCLEIR